MDEKFSQISKSVMCLFLEHGVRNLSMDEICKHLRISKKTLYRYVDNKEDLISKILEEIKQRHDDPSAKCKVEGRNAIEVLFFASKHLYEFQIKVKKPFRFDLEKYYPHLWETFRETMREKSVRFIRQNIEQGITEGLYRSNLDIQLSTTLYLAKINGVHADFALNPEKYTYRQLFEALFEHQIRALATREGIDFLEEKIGEFKIDSE